MTSNVIPFDARRRARAARPHDVIEQIDQALTTTSVWGRHAPVTCQGRAETVRAVTHLLRTSPNPVLVVSWDEQMNWTDHIVAHWAGVDLLGLTSENLDLAEWQRVVAVRRALHARTLTIATAPAAPARVVHQFQQDHPGEVVVVIIEAPQTRIETWFAGTLDNQRVVTIRATV